MASPAEIAQILPDTLPEDFSEWDGEGASPAGHAEAIEPAGGVSVASMAEPMVQGIVEPELLPAPKMAAPVAAELVSESSTEPELTSADHAVLVSRLKNFGSTLKSKTPTTTTQIQPTACLKKDESLLPRAKNSTPEPAAEPLLPAKAAADEEAFYNHLRAVGNALEGQPSRGAHKPTPSRQRQESSSRIVTSILAVETTPSAAIEEEDGVVDEVGASGLRLGLANAASAIANRKKWIKVGGTSFVTLMALTILVMRVLGPSKPTLAHQTVDVTPAVTVPAAVTITEQRKPSPSTPMPVSRAAVSAPAVQQSFNQTPAKPQTAAPQPVDAQPMNDQLTAAPKIPQDIKAKPKEDEPPPPSEGFGTATPENESSNHSMDGVFGGQARPNVKYVPYPVVTVASAVAEGLLMQKAQPVYPSSAWYSGVTGKVLLQATVSRLGTVEKVQYVNGPGIFRQAAIDAVKRWRFRPYLIDSVPREFQTTIEVAFDQKSASNPLAILHKGSRAKNTLAENKTEGVEAQ